MDSPDCLLILLSVSVFYFLLFLSSTLQLLVPCGIDYADLCRLLSAR